MNTTSLNMETLTVGKTALPKGLFDQKVKPVIIAQAVRVYLANQRAAAAKTKTRGEVEGSTRKIYRQKGTGRARHGSNRAPVFVGGGAAHGPSGEQNYKLRMPKGMGPLAIVGALSSKAGEGQVVILEGVPQTYKTAVAEEALKKTGLGQRPLILTDRPEIRRMWQNVSGAYVVGWQSVNVYQILRARPLFISSEALEGLKKKYA